MVYSGSTVKQNLINNPLIKKIGLLKAFFIAMGGLIYYWLSNKTPQAAYLAMINLHCATSGRFTLFLGRIFSLLTPYTQNETIQNSVLGEFGEDKIKSIINDINTNGYYIFEEKLPKKRCDELEKIAREFSCLINDDTELTEISPRFNEEEPLSQRYRLKEADIIQQEQVQEMMADPLFRTIAGKYTASNSILCSVNIWWSAVFNKGIENSDYSAQQYHFDMSRSRWLNFFVYLSDVDENSGPHCYIRGSHKFTNNSKGDLLLQRGYTRISDEEIKVSYNTSDIMELTGKRGTIMAVDTRGFHKGKTLIKGYRLMFEMVFSSSLYGGAYRNQKIHYIKSSALQKAMAKFKRTYTRYIT